MKKQKSHLNFTLYKLVALSGYSFIWVPLFAIIGIPLFYILSYYIEQASYACFSLTCIEKKLDFDVVLPDYIAKSYNKNYKIKYSLLRYYNSGKRGKGGYSVILTSKKPEKLGYGKLELKAVKPELWPESYKWQEFYPGVYNMTCQKQETISVYNGGEFVYSLYTPVNKPFKRSKSTEEFEIRDGIPFEIFYAYIFTDGIGYSVTITDFPDSAAYTDIEQMCLGIAAEHFAKLFS